jgi:mannose-1-phosphate guanylyltransferase / mannose-6-phosphate isomerase
MTKNTVKKITPIILSGGCGSRLWPVSRPSFPKQFVKIDEQSFFQKTILRVNKKDIFKPSIIVANNEQRFVLSEQLKEIDVNSSSIILEPEAKNTAPAIAAGALEVFQNSKKDDDLILVLPADHVISNEKSFISAVKKAVKLAQDDYLALIGVKISDVQTGYGYIEKGATIGGKIYEVASFTEKPDIKKAKEFCEDKNYLFHSGIFLCKASIYLHHLRQNNNKTFIKSVAAHNNAHKDLGFLRLAAEDFGKCSDVSVDHAIMENVQKLAVLEAEIGWQDIGNWEQMSSLHEQDKNDNSFYGENIMAMNSKNCHIHSPEKLVATMGVKNLIIICTTDAVLVANKNNPEDIKRLYSALKKQKIKECWNSRKTHRPWGSFEVIESGQGFKIKRVIVRPNSSLSLQMHNHRTEHWCVVSGAAFVTCGDRKFVLTKNQSTAIEVGKKHCLENRGKVDLEIIEIQSGDYLEEDDIIRFSDF